MVESIIKKAMLKISIAILIFAVLVGLMTALLYGFGDDHLDELQIKDVTGEVIGKGKGFGDFNLGLLPNREGSDYRGQAYEGYQDPKQVAMARELLEIYENSAKAETELLAKGFPLIDIIHFTIGTHLTESDTYNGQPGAPAKTYIPKTMVEWDKYGTATTVDGKVMNFTNYNAKDFEKDFLEDRKKLGLSTTKPYSSPGSRSGNTANYDAGYRVSSMRSYTGAVGGTQMQPTVFKSSPYVQGNRQPGNPDWITDPVAYAKEPNNARGESYLGNGPADIFNPADGIRSTAAWVNKSLNEGSNIFKKKPELDINENPLVTIMYIGGSYLNGDHGFSSKIVKDWDRIHNAHIAITKDQEGYNELFEYYKGSFGHGSDGPIIHSLFAKHGVGGTSTGSVVGFRDYSWVHEGRVWAKGLAWYEFLQGIAYGDQINPGNPELNPSIRPSGDKGKVMYNYMNETNGLRKSQGALTKNDLDSYYAIGYKGPYPLFNQNMDYNAGYYMGGKYTFKSACTVYAATSAILGLGETPKYKTFDTDGNGSTTPMEYWSHAHSNRNTTPYNITSRPNFGLASIHQTILNADYETSGIYSAKTNIEMRKEHIRQGYPVHIRTSGGVNYTGIIPKTPLNQLDYRKHDMYDLESYDWSNPKGMKLASNGHSTIAIDIIEYNGKEYISIVDSAYNHSGGYDSHLVWWEADKLLKTSDWSSSWTVFGGEGLTPITGGQGPVTGTGPPPKPTVEYEGEESGVAVFNIFTERESGEGEAELIERGLDTNELRNTTGFNLKGKIKGSYETRIKEASPYERESSGLYIITGKSGDITQAIEVTNVVNPIQQSKRDRENTELFDLPAGQTAVVKVGFFRKSDNLFIYTDIRND